MKQLFRCCLAVFFAACTLPGADPVALETTSEVDPRTVSVEQALNEMYSLMEFLHGSGTRAAQRRVANIEALKGSLLGKKTRSGVALPENLAYVVNFENNGGFAILGASTLGEPVYCITEQGSLTAGKIETTTSIINGRQTRELLHCNFGWGGRANGYYLSKIFDPTQGPEVDSDGDPDNDIAGKGLLDQDIDIILAQP